MRHISTTELTTEIETEFDASTFAKSVEISLTIIKKIRGKTTTGCPSMHWGYKAAQMEVIPLGLTAMTDKK